MSEPERIEYLGVVAGHQYLAERGAPQRRIPRAEIESIDVRRGSPVQHPMLLFLFGLVAVAAGLYPIRRLVQWWWNGGMLWDREVLLLIFLPLGIHSLWEAVQRVPILLVRTTRGVKRVAFRGKVRPEELRQFLRRLETDFGYPVSADLP
jgi:hypothetical protein